MNKHDDQNIIIQVQFNIADYKGRVISDLYRILKFAQLNLTNIERETLKGSRTLLTFRILRALGYADNHSLLPPFFKFIGDIADETNMVNYQDQKAHQAFLNKVADKILQSFADRYQEEQLRLCELI